MSLNDQYKLGLISAKEMKKYEVDTKNTFYYGSTRMVKEEAGNEEELFRYAVVKRLNTLKNIALVFFIFWLLDLVVGLLSMLF